MELTGGNCFPTTDEYVCMLMLFAAAVCSACPCGCCVAVVVAAAAGAPSCEVPEPEVVRLWCRCVAACFPRFLPSPGDQRIPIPWIASYAVATVIWAGGGAAPTTALCSALR